MDRYEAQYAYDMKAQAAVEICEKAGADLIRSGNGYWRWKRGPHDSYNSEGHGYFETRDQAAIDFTESVSFRMWLRSGGANV